MYYNYSFWRQLFNPASLTNILSKEYEDGAKIVGYKKALILIFLFTMAFFTARNIWGIGTESLTEVLVVAGEDRYVVARLLSLAGALLFGLGFWAFHYYILSYVITALTEIPVKWVKKVQLYVLFFIVLEKVLTFVVFAIAGFNTPFTFFSLAPMIAYIYYNEFLLFFLNQLTVATLVTVAVQYRFFSQWIDSSKKALFIKLILIQVTIAIAVAALSVLPIVHWIERGLS